MTGKNKHGMLTHQIKFFGNKSTICIEIEWYLSSSRLAYRLVFNIYSDK